MSNPDRPTTHCAACGWLVYADAEQCKHCHAPRERMVGPPPPKPAAPRCPACNGRVQPSSLRCKHCGADLPTP